MTAKYQVQYIKGDRIIRDDMKFHDKKLAIEYFSEQPPTRMMQDGTVLHKKLVRLADNHTLLPIG